MDTNIQTSVSALSIKDFNANAVILMLWHCKQLRENVFSIGAQHPKALVDIKNFFLNYIIGKSQLSTQQFYQILQSNGIPSIFYEEIYTDVVSYWFENKKIDAGLSKFSEIQNCLIPYKTQESSSSSYLPILKINDAQYMEAISSRVDLSTLDTSRVLITDFISLKSNAVYCKDYFPDLIMISTYIPSEDFAIRFCLLYSIPSSLSPNELFQGKSSKTQHKYSLKALICEQSLCPISYFRIADKWVEYNFNKITKYSSLFELMQQLIISNAIPMLAIYEKSSDLCPELTHEEFICIYKFCNERYALYNANKEEDNSNENKAAENPNPPLKDVEPRVEVIPEETKAKKEFISSKYIEEVGRSEKAEAKENELNGIEVKDIGTNLSPSYCIECNKLLVSPEEINILTCSNCIAESIKQEQNVEEIKQNQEQNSWKCNKCFKINTVLKYKCERKHIIRLQLQKGRR